MTKNVSERDWQAELARLQKLVDRSPHNTWLGLRFTAAGPEGIVIETGWREEFISAPERRAVHGGVLAGLVDSGVVFAVMAASGVMAATVDLRVDYHAIPASDAMRISAKVIRLGRTLATAQASVYDATGRLTASGRGTVMVPETAEGRSSARVRGP